METVSHRISLCNYANFKSIPFGVLYWLIFFIPVYIDRAMQFGKSSGESLSQPYFKSDFANLPNELRFHQTPHVWWIKISIASQLNNNSQLSSSHAFPCVIKTIKHLIFEKKNLFFTFNFIYICHAYTRWFGDSDFPWHSRKGNKTYCTFCEYSCIE